MSEDAGSIYSQIRFDIAKLQGDINTAIGAINGLGVKIDESTTKAEQTANKNFNAMAIGVLAFSTAVLGAMRNAVTGFADFEQSMANVRAATGATVEEFGMLKNAAEQAGATTRFSASEAADALYYLGSAGLDAAQSVAALDGVLALAQATGSELAFTSDTVASSLSQFGLNADQATRVANVFAQAIGDSQANLQKLQTSLRQVGPVAGALGISLEETVANLEALYNAGFQGEQAGTALRSILLELSDASSTTSKKLAEAGVTLTNSLGQFVGLTEAVDILGKSGLALGEIFGKEVAAQMIVLAKTGGDALRELEAGITGTNAAAEMAAIQNDTLKGAWDELTSSMENFTNKGVEAVAPMLKGLLSIFKGVLDVFGSLPKPVQAIIFTLLGLGAAFAAASGAASIFGVSLATALGPVGLIVAGISAAVIAISAGIASAVDEAKKANEQLIISNNEILAGFQQTRKSIRDILGETEKLNKTQKLSADQISKLIELYPELTTKIDLQTASIEDVEQATRELQKTQAEQALRAIESQKKVNEELIKTKKAALESTGKRENYKESIKLMEEQIAQQKRLQEELKNSNKSEQERADFIRRSNKQIEFLTKSINKQKEFTTDEIERIRALEAQQARLTQQEEKLKDEISGVAAVREEATRKALSSIDKIASRQGRTSNQIIEDLKKERDAQAKLYTDEKAIGNVRVAFSEKIAGLVQAQKDKEVAANQRARQEIEKSVKGEIADIELKRKEALKDVTDKALIVAVNKKYDDEIAENKKKAQEKIQKELDDQAAKEKEYVQFLATVTGDKIKLLDLEKEERLASMREQGRSLEEIQAVEKYYDEQKKRLVDDSIKREEERAKAIEKIDRDLAGNRTTVESDVTKKKLETLEEEKKKYEDLKIDQSKVDEWYANEKKKITDESNDEINKANLAAFKKDVDTVKWYVDQFSGALTGLFGALADLYQAQNELAQDALEADYQAQVDALDALQEKRLEEAGLREDTALEAAQKELDAALASQDQEAIALAQNELTKQKILDDTAKEKARIEKEYQKKKAQLEYEGELNTWNANLATAIATGAQATLNAFTTGMQAGFPAAFVTTPLLTALAATTAGIQIAAIASAKPQPPQLATGGIVIPSAGGTQAVLAENGSAELALNAGAEGRGFLNQFADLLGERIGTGGGGGMMQLVIQLDGQVISDTVVEYVKNGRTELTL